MTGAVWAGMGAGFGVGLLAGYFYCMRDLCKRGGVASPGVTSDRDSSTDLVRRPYLHAFRGSPDWVLKLEDQIRSLPEVQREEWLS